ncbi:hypothetical protein CDAR_180571 [Caerostris darwini]|uniref:Uncharacterized protein n=1 Tax=Caerostris darwini TaxID=1538125 RepID=A0AAV4UGY2_9ARAC|nr:hypothetical protein CDAR_180571 [Caerostris darwini]
MKRNIANQKLLSPDTQGQLKRLDKVTPRPMLPYLGVKVMHPIHHGQVYGVRHLYKRAVLKSWREVLTALMMPQLVTYVVLCVCVCGLFLFVEDKFVEKFDLLSGLFSFLSKSDECKETQKKDLM